MVGSLAARWVDSMVDSKVDNLAVPKAESWAESKVDLMVVRWAAHLVDLSVEWRAGC